MRLREVYVVGAGEVGAAPESVAEEMGELLDEIAATDDPSVQALTAAACLHAKFENIHPFADGNGRAGRVLMNYFLLVYHHPPITVFDVDRTTYYQALGAFDLNQDIQPLKFFLERQTVKTWEKTLRRERRRSNRNQVCVHPEEGDGQFNSISRLLLLP
ncbi:MAG: Fic family protein [Coriobacteriales bacterium]|jgi:Fic family protein|nr:Fic family protein [Coriobacteriales bacterium]